MLHPSSTHTHERKDAAPLAGVVVVSLEQAIAAPLCTRHLADLGARVIKIERPEGGDFARSYDGRVRGLSSHFVWVNRSKESLVLDLKRDLGKRVLERLLERCDVLVQNLAPGAAARLGLDFESLHGRFSRLIACDISGYGERGPYRNKKAYDLLIQAEAGLLSVTGSESEPAKAGCSVADIAAGMYAHSAILAALFQRQHTGRGTRIDISMFDVMVEWMGYPMYYAFEGAEAPKRTGTSHATIAPYGAFATNRDFVFLAVQNEREWVRFCSSVLEQPALVDDPRFSSNQLRVRHCDDLKRVIEHRFKTLSADEVIRQLDQAGIANGAMNGMRELWLHPQLLARDAFVDVGSAAGPIPAMVPTWLPQTFDPPMGGIPALGEHTEAILTELGFVQRDIDALRAEGVTMSCAIPSL